MRQDTGNRGSIGQTLRARSCVGCGAIGMDEVGALPSRSSQSKRGGGLTLSSLREEVDTPSNLGGEADRPLIPRGDSDAI